MAGVAWVKDDREMRVTTIQSCAQSIPVEIPGTGTAAVAMMNMEIGRMKLDKRISSMWNEVRMCNIPK